ncbi:MAG: hypothetical protein FWD39_05280 [Clostridiales bacterium]|nr:hypothetical protein [Clostridiales bacterium]
MNEPSGSNPNPGYHYPQHPNYPPPPPPPPPGRGMIKVTGILLIIFGGLGIFGAIAVLSLLWAVPEVGDIIKDEFGPAVITYMFYALIVTAIYLAFGIIGMNNAGKAAKAQIVVNMGIILIALQAIDFIIQITFPEVRFDSELPSVIVGALIGLVLPVLYVVGGNMNKNSLKS